MRDLIAAVIIGFIIGCAIGAAVMDTEANNAYKRGQIDAANHKMKYELITHPDKTTTWELKKSYESEIK